MRSLEVLTSFLNALTELPSSIGRLSNLTSLSLSHNRLTRLPDSLANCRKLRHLHVGSNQLVELPLWVANLPHLSTLATNNNPWQHPPASVVTCGSGHVGDGLSERLSAIRRYYADLEAHGAIKSQKVKIVLVGTGEAGKSSTLRGMKHGEPRPFEADERTVQLDIWTLTFGAPPTAEGEEDRRIVASVWDFAGQPECAAGQQQYLVDGALYVLHTPAHRLNDAEYPEVLGRWLDTLQACAPGAVVQLVITHADRLADPAPASLNPDDLATA